MTQPIGTSPAAVAACASSSARSMKVFVGMVSDRSPQLCYHAAARAASPTIRHMDRNNDPPATGERIAKVIARAGLASRREAEAWIVAGDRKSTRLNSSHLG